MTDHNLPAALLDMDEAALKGVRDLLDTALRVGDAHPSLSATMEVDMGRAWLTVTINTPVEATP